MKRLRSQVRSAWEQFQSEGTLADGIDPIIARSWKRARRFGVLSGLKAAPQANSASLGHHLHKMSDVLGLSDSVLSQGRLLLQDSGCMIVMTAPDGTVVSTTGDERVIDQGRENHLSVGGRWDEALIGTNAIGTSIREKAPSLVHGSQHFCEDIQKWSCAASPILDPVDGAVRGVLDISGASDTFLPQNYALAVSLADQIKHLLSLKISQEHEYLLDQFIQLRTRWGNNPLMLFDQRGTKIYDTSQPHLPYQPSGLVLPDMGEKAWLDALLQNHPTYDAELIIRDKAVVGAVLVAARRRPAGPTTASDPFSSFIGQTDAIVELKKSSRRAAQTSSPIVIKGEPGTGRRRLARAIHKAAGGDDHGVVFIDSRKAREPIEAERTLAHSVHGETICLEDTTELPPEFLSRFLKNISPNKVQTRQPPPRVIILTCQDLDEIAGSVPSEYTHCLKTTGVQLNIPPLRERSDDIIRLANRFITNAAVLAKRPVPVLSANAQKVLRSYHWPGNVRELQVELSTLVLFCPGGIIAAEDLPRHFHHRHDRSKTQAPLPEREKIIRAIRENQGNMSRTARALGIARSTLYLKLETHSISKNEIGN